MDGLYRAMGEAKRNAAVPQFCDACFTGDYAVELVDMVNNCSSGKGSGLRERGGAKKR